MCISRGDKLNLNKTLHFAIQAGTLTGNRGAEAMLTASIEQIRNQFPTSIIHILTYSPKSDMIWFLDHPLKDVFLHSSSPATLVFKWFPLSLLAKCLPFLKSPPKTKHGLGICSLLRIDGVIDLAGVSFIDSREKFLPFNVLSLFPFLLHDVPVWKLSQAMGPITSLPNRICAGWALSKVRLIVARGALTKKYLSDFGVPNTQLFSAPDVAFLLSLSNPVLPINERPYDICVIPSAVMQKKNPNYLKLITDSIQELLDTGMKVRIVLHSWKVGTEKTFNNDLPLAKQILGGLKTRSDVQIVGPRLDARGIKAAISEHRFCLTSRFHGMIAALDTATPCLVLGWSHKYKEVLQDFDLDPWALSAHGLSAQELSLKVRSGVEQASLLSEKISATIPGVRAQAVLQFQRIFDSC